ncbi:MAG: hypothetical protein HY959_03520 [Ignavibacteriae bacterium]|nr:hypothetical protein [Ignavibacteriota bacterium]
MDYKIHFLELLGYTHWADLNVADVLKRNDIKESKTNALFSHIINAEIILLARIKKSKLFDPFEVRSVEENIRLAEEINKEWKIFLETLPVPEFDRIVEYVNIKGEQVKAKICDIFMHMVNHSTYHRGQTAAAIRSLNVEPPVTDYISYTRSKTK